MREAAVQQSSVCTGRDFGSTGVRTERQHHYIPPRPRLTAKITQIAPTYHNMMTPQKPGELCAAASLENNLARRVFCIQRACPDHSSSQRSGVDTRRQRRRSISRINMERPLSRCRPADCTELPDLVTNMFPTLHRAIFTGHECADRIGCAPATFQSIATLAARSAWGFISETAVVFNLRASRQS